jgi:hypothetical protein
MQLCCTHRPSPLQNANWFARATANAGLAGASECKRWTGWRERERLRQRHGWLAACLVRATASADRTFQEASVYRKRRVYRKTSTLRRRRGVSGPHTVRPQLRILIFSVQPNAHQLSRASERVSAAASTSHTAKYRMCFSAVFPGIGKYYSVPLATIGSACRVLQRSGQLRRKGERLRYLADHRQTCTPPI